MYFEIAAISAVVIFAILTFFIIKTLLTLRKTLEHVDQLTLDLNIKIKNLDSTLHALSNLGDICEDRTAHVKHEQVRKKAIIEAEDDYSDDLADWLVASLKIGTKYLIRKK